jgi:type I restriction enzyme S subunit
MDSKTFFDNFEIIANAPGGIARLRELILELAVRGKLVSSDPKDWKSSTLGEAVEIIRGVTFPASAKQRAPGKGLIPCLRTTNVQNEVDWDDLLYISKEYVRKDSQYVQLDDVLISMANSRELVGKVALVRRNDVQCTLGGFIAAIRCGDTILPRFLIALLRVPSAREKLIDSSTQTTNIANISLGRLNPFELSLPPITEQKRIVAKVDELMALCDELEDAHQKRNSIRTAARRSAIDAISTATTPSELNTAWKRIGNNWLTIADTPESIASLRSLILDLAVRGKLMSNLEKMAHSEVRFIELGSVMTLEYGKPLDKSLRTIKGQVPVYGANGVKAMTGKSLVENRGIVVGRKGSAGEVNITDGPFWPLDVTFFAKFDEDSFDLQYLYYLLKSLDLPKMARGIKPGINRNDVNKLKVLSVDLTEQRRIVTKVDELMSLCDQLDKSLLERQEFSRKFSGAVVAGFAV